MREYNLELTENELKLKFHFKKSSMIFHIVFFTTLFTIFFVFSKPGSVYNSWGALLFMFCLFLFLTFEEYFEWKKYKIQNIKKVNNEIFINDRNLYKNYNIKSVNTVYSNSQYFGGWTVYLSTHYGTKDYTIKTRLKKEDAVQIANHIGTFLEKEVIEDH
jgi:hypothetical protein